MCNIVHHRPVSLMGIKKRLGYLKPTALAKKLKIVIRKPKKITIPNLLLSYWLLVSKRNFSYENWSEELSLLGKKVVSSQAIWKRIDSEMVAYTEALLQKSVRQKSTYFLESQLFESFENVEIQDATHLTLPDKMKDVFPSSGGKGKNSSTAKIQAVFNLKKGQFSDFKLGSFRDNDQADSPRYVQKLRKGDLLIRDLGYSVLDVFNEISDKGAYFLSRYKYGVTVFDAGSGKRIDLAKKLKKNRYLDIEVKLGTEKKVSCRLVAVRLPEEVANVRRMRAAKERHEDANHSDHYMELLGYNIFITNVPPEIWTVEQTVKAYRCRWYIEILFKGWKSHLNFVVTLPERFVNEYRVKFFFYATLLMVTLLVMPFFVYLQKRAIDKGRQVSILKVCEFVSSFLSRFIEGQEQRFLLEVAEKKCLYQFSNKRKNSMQLIYTDF